MTLDPLDPTFMPTTQEGKTAQRMKTLERRLAVLERKSLNGGSDPVGSLIARLTLALPPGGYLYCDGSEVSRTTYGALFAQLFAEGLPTGAGNGTTTFNLPDLRGRMLVGVGTHGDVNAIGDNDGRTVDFRTPRINIDHTHGFLGTTADASQPGQPWEYGGNSSINMEHVSHATHTHTFSGTTGGSSVSTVNGAYLAVHYFIKA